MDKPEYVEADPDGHITELEAALETKTTWWLNEKARAEKAEARAAELEAEAKVHILDGMTQRARAEKAETVSRPEECPWRETDLGCPCEVPGLDNDGVRDKALVDAADALKKAEARVAELEGVYEAEACPTCGVTQVALWETHQSIHKAREREAE